MEQSINTESLHDVQKIEVEVDEQDDQFVYDVSDTPPWCVILTSAFQVNMGSDLQPFTVII